MALHLSVWFDPLLKVPISALTMRKRKILPHFHEHARNDLQWKMYRLCCEPFCESILAGCADLARRHALKKAPALKSPFLRGYAGMGSKKVSD